ncbi:hypothetical protein EGJ34_21965 [Stenotrophomonas sp. 278]|nr:hypothetical protein EGJ34_21965 [Stenotrophomonas sp. 278]
MAMDKDLNPMTSSADTRGMGMKAILGAQLRRAALVVVGLVASLTVSAAETFEYIHTDALGSPVAVTDANGVVIERMVYEPYGALVGGPVKDGPGYTGHVSDSATGLSYMQQRYMDPEIGAFLSADPVTAHAQPASQFSRYRYANSSPYRNIDPDGRRACGTDTGCQLEQGAYGGVMMVNSSGQERGERQAAAIATRATNAANQALSSLAGAQYKSTGAAGRAWTNKIRRIGVLPRYHGRF